MGANIGTTVTTLIAALSTGAAGALAVAFTHMLFNLSGVAIFLPIRRIRAIPVDLAQGLAALTLRSRWYAVAYVAVAFFVIPLLLLFLWR